MYHECITTTDDQVVYLIHLFPAQNRSKQIVWMDTSQRDINDKLDSLHRRMDKFYEWAAILQKEFRDMQQRQVFIESQCTVELNASNALEERLEKIKENRDGTAISQNRAHQREETKVELDES
jgi:hypothetical protein